MKHYLIILSLSEERDTPAALISHKCRGEVRPAGRVGKKDRLRSRVQGGLDRRHTVMAADGEQLRSYGEDKMGRK